MASLDFLLQAVTKRHHAGVLKELLELENTTSVTGSVAFVRATGVDEVKDQLTALGKKARFFVGIRNDVTTYQGVQRLLDLGVSVYGVDTGSRHTIFHPKIFMATAKARAEVIIGSANLTFGGLYNNIEAGVLLSLDLLDAEDKAFVAQATDIFDDLPKNHPDHVFQIKTKAAIEALFNEGRLADETIVRAPSVTSSVKKGDRDRLKPMKLAWHQPPPRQRAKVKKPAAAPAAVVAGGVVVQPVEEVAGVLVWQSNALKERDLNIPKGENTHATGSMLWKKGAVDGVDQRHFFRDEVFSGLGWWVDPKLKHYERAEAEFELIVKGLNYGKTKLRLSHNTDETSRSYEQGNSMTSVHWTPEVRKIIGKEDLLDRTMSLYRRETAPPEFVIEID